MANRRTLPARNQTPVALGLLFWAAFGLNPSVYSLCLLRASVSSRITLSNDNDTNIKIISIICTATRNKDYGLRNTEHRREKGERGKGHSVRNKGRGFDLSECPWGEELFNARNPTTKWNKSWDQTEMTHFPGKIMFSWFSNDYYNIFLPTLFLKLGLF